MMKKFIQKLAVCVLALPLLIASCSESSVDPYDNWDARNKVYIDSIAAVANANLGDEVGQWKKIRSYKLPDLNIGEVGATDEYVYCQIKSVGNGTVRPISTDSVLVNYRGRLINKKVFDQNYTGEYDPRFATPVKFVLGGVITGWTTALQYMHEGDYWNIYIPYTMAYGSSGAAAIPGYSALDFDVDLRKIIPLKGHDRLIDGESELEE
ncbi:MAG: FKBP-type peptidyl-prolyl cis-trans isomerase [Phocaeicola sp.]